MNPPRLNPTVLALVQLVALERARAGLLAVPPVEPESIRHEHPAAWLRLVLGRPATADATRGAT